MIFQRVFKILSSNFNSTIRGKEGKVFEEQTFEEGKRNTEVDPLKVKEAEFYANLELKYGAGFSEIKEAYKKLIKKYHPDKFNKNEEQRKIAEAITTRLNEAYNYFEKKFRKT